jgi:hypothetical protein
MVKREGRAGKPFTVYLPEELSERLTASARRNYRTKSAQLILALEKFLAEDEHRIDMLTAPPQPPPKPKQPPKRCRKKEE